MVKRRGCAAASALFALAGLVIVQSCLAVPARAESSRRIGASLSFGYYMLDDDFFGLDDAPCVSVALRYELKNNIFFENRVGLIRSSQDGLSLNVLACRSGITAILPFFIPWRPALRGGFAMLATNPVTVTPIDSFRPSQTTFYLFAGTGVTRSITESLFGELSFDAMITPYKYRVYAFNRQQVDEDPHQFLHLGVTLGLSYIF